MKKEGIFHAPCVFLKKNQKSFRHLTVYKHFGLPLAILSLLRQPFLKNDPLKQIFVMISELQRRNKGMLLK